MREAHVERNRAVQASGREAPGERTLEYVVAHEVTHAMTGDFLGGSYLRYTLRVAHLLEKEGWTVPALLRSPPAAAAVESRLRAAPAS